MILVPPQVPYGQFRWILIPPRFFFEQCSANITRPQFASGCASYILAVPQAAANYFSCAPAAFRAPFELFLFILALARAAATML